MASTGAERDGSRRSISAEHVRGGFAPGEEGSSGGQTIEERSSRSGRRWRSSTSAGRARPPSTSEGAADEDGRRAGRGVGDRIEAMSRFRRRRARRSPQIGARRRDERQLEDAFYAGLPVEGKVERAVKRRRLQGRIAGQRGFLPDLADRHGAKRGRRRHTKDGSTRSASSGAQGGRQELVVVSRRARFSRTSSARTAEVRSLIVPGSVLTGA